MGKTTTAVNLATALAAIGERVLIVDVDPQGNASTGFGIDREDRPYSAFDLMTGEVELEQAIVGTSVPNVMVVPSTMDLLGLEMAISEQGDRAFKLRNALKDAGSLLIDGKPITYILVDCPPSLNLLTINSLAAADAVLVPMQCEFFCVGRFEPGFCRPLSRSKPH